MFWILNSRIKTHTAANYEINQIQLFVFVQIIVGFIKFVLYFPILFI